MIAVDTNVLVYAHRREAREHAVASRRLRELASASEPWAIPWPCVYEFFSVVTNRRIWKDAASTPAQAWQQLEAWFASPSLQLLSETDDFSDVLAPLLVRPRVVGAIVHDARIPSIQLSSARVSLTANCSAGSARGSRGQREAAVLSSRARSHCSPSSTVATAVIG